MARDHDPSEDGYVDVAARIAQFRNKYPDGSLQPANPLEPIRVHTVGDRTYLEYTAAAYRNPDDPRPGMGITWEPIPGSTPYTKNSEAQNAETSAWGRAIVAVLAADSKKIASADEVANRRGEQNGGPHATEAWLTGFAGAVMEAVTDDQLNGLLDHGKHMQDTGMISRDDARHCAGLIRERRAAIHRPGGLREVPLPDDGPSAAAERGDAGPEGIDRG